MKFKFVEPGRWKCDVSGGKIMARRVMNGWRVQLIKGPTMSQGVHIGWFNNMKECREWLAEFAAIYNRSPWVTVGEALDEMKHGSPDERKAQENIDNAPGEIVATNSGAGIESGHNRTESAVETKNRSAIEYGASDVVCGVCGGCDVRRYSLSFGHFGSTSQWECESCGHCAEWLTAEKTSGKGGVPISRRVLR